MNSTQFYLIFYTAFVLIAGTATFLKVIPPDIFIAGLFGVLGHATGLFSPSPAAPVPPLPPGEEPKP